MNLQSVSTRFINHVLCRHDTKADGNVDYLSIDKNGKFCWNDSRKSNGSLWKQLYIERWFVLTFSIDDYFFLKDFWRMLSYSVLIDGKIMPIVLPTNSWLHLTEAMEDVSISIVVVDSKNERDGRSSLSNVQTSLLDKSDSCVSCLLKIHLFFTHAF